MIYHNIYIMSITQFKRSTRKTKQSLAHYVSTTFTSKITNHSNIILVWEIF